MAPSLWHLRVTRINCWGIGHNKRRRIRNEQCLSRCERHTGSGRGNKVRGGDAWGNADRGSERYSWGVKFCRRLRKSSAQYGGWRY